MGSVALIITTYNHVLLLEKMLLSISRQTILPNEIIFADDGSDEDVLKMIMKMKHYFKSNMKFISQKHNGFRAAKVRNNGVKIAESDYLIFLDHDILVTPGYIETHIKHKQEGKFLVGLPIRLSQEESLKITPEIILNNAYDRVIPRKNLKKIHNQYFKDYYYYLETKWLRRKGYKPKLRAGVFSIYKKDFLMVDGFDESFVDRGGEDDDLGQRLALVNIHGKNVFYDEFPLHLFHPPNRMGVKLDIENKWFQKKRRTEPMPFHGISNPLYQEPLIIKEIK